MLPRARAGLPDVVTDRSTDSNAEPMAMSSKIADLARFLPGLRVLDGYSRPRLRLDTIAALSVWAVVVPQGLAYGELAGIPAVAGLYTAAAGMLLYGLFGSSRYLNVGPESSVAIVVAASVAPLAGGDPERAIALTSMLAILVGGVLLVGALLRLGVVTRLLSAPILTGYLAGAAVIIAASQIPKLFGISPAGDEWWQQLGDVASNLDATNGWSLGIGICVIVVLLVLQRIVPRLPASLIAMAVATVVVAATDWASSNGVAVVGEVGRGIPVPAIPRAPLADMFSLLAPAGSIALLVFASSVATGSALASRDREDLDTTREFVGLAAAGVGAGLIQGFPANGSDSRSFIVANSEARSQSANMIAAVMVLITVLLLTPLFRNLPIAALGAVVLVSAISLVDIARFRSLRRVRTSDFILSLVTFLGVLTFGVLGGIVIGVVVSLLETMRRAILPHTAVLGEVAGSPTFRDIENYEDAETVPGLIVYRFDSPLFFANADVFKHDIQTLVARARHPVRQLVVNAEGITDMDVTGAEALERVIADLRDDGVRFAMARVRTSLREMIKEMGLEEKIGSENFFLRVADAASGFRSVGSSSSPSP
jgi:sulfate permease, SulP family